MKKLMILILLVLQIGCKSSTEKSQFDNYISTLQEVELPFKYSSENLIKQIEKPSFDSLYFQLYKQVWAEFPIGLISKNKNYILIMDAVMSDNGYVPYITSYDLNGNKIDSLNAFQKAGYDMGYKAVEYVTIKKNLTIQVIDSVWRHALTEDKNDIIKGSQKLTIGKQIYRVNSNGYFE